MDWSWIVYGVAILVFLYGFIKLGHWCSDLPNKLELKVRRILADYKNWSRIDDDYSAAIDSVDHHGIDIADRFATPEMYEFLKYELRRLDLLIYREDARHEFLLCADDAVLNRLAAEYKEIRHEIENHPDREKIEAERLAEIESNDVVES